MDRAVAGLRNAVDRSRRTLRRASRYDLVLALIPAAFLLAAIAGSTLPVSSTTAVLAAGLLSGMAIVDALFLNPPRGPAAGPPASPLR